MTAKWCVKRFNDCVGGEEVDRNHEHSPSDEEYESRSNISFYTTIGDSGSGQWIKTSKFRTRSKDRQTFTHQEMFTVDWRVFHASGKSD